MFGGRLMDTFMDKLAQKLTAQEMIKANMAADAEEMNRLKEKTRNIRNVWRKCRSWWKMVRTKSTKHRKIQRQS